MNNWVTALNAWNANSDAFQTALVEVRAEVDQRTDGLILTSPHMELEGCRMTASAVIHPSGYPDDTLAFMIVGLGEGPVEHQRLGHRFMV
jgi:hypothetical protein